MNPPPTTPARRPVRRRAMHVVRRGHLYLGMFLLPWAVLYGITGFLFNHPTAFSDQDTGTFSAGAMAGTPMGEVPTPEAIAGRVVAGLNERADDGRSYRLAEPSEAGYEARTLAFATVTTADGRKVGVLFDVAHGGGTVREQPPAAPTADPTPAPFAVGTGGRGNRGPREGAPSVRPSDRLAIPDPLHDRVRASVPAALAATGFPEPTEVTVTNVPDLTFRMIDESDRTWRVTFNAMTGSVSGRPAESETGPEPISVRRFLTRLHLAHGYPAGGGVTWWWAVIVDVMSFVMVFWGVSGLLMWWQIQATRWLGMAVLIASAAAAVALAAGMHAVLASG